MSLAILPPPPMLLLRGGEVFAPEPRGRADLLLAGGRVVAIGQIEAPPSGWPVTVLELDGRRVIPGLVDAHVHLAGGGGEAGAATRVRPVELTHLTQAGVTTAIGLLGTDVTTRNMAELLANARGLSELGLTALCYTGGYAVPPVTLTGSVRGDITHVDRIVAAGEIAISDHRSSQPTFDEIARLAADCHVAGLMTGKAGVLHLHLGDGSRGLELVRRCLDETELPPRTFHPTHCNRNRSLWAEAKALSKRGIYVDVTAFPADDDTLSAAAAIADWLDSGLDPARLTCSSDGGGCLPVFGPDGRVAHMDVGRSSSLCETLAELLAAGRSLPEVLPVMTSNVAQLFRLSGKGGLAPGADADVVVLDEHARPYHVLAGGRWFVRDGAPTVRGPFEPMT
jgi:beta-aspartyl-dipeptidase (metallo-type)